MQNARSVLCTAGVKVPPIEDIERSEAERRLGGQHDTPEPSDALQVAGIAFPVNSDYQFRDYQQEMTMAKGTTKATAAPAVPPPPLPPTASHAAPEPAPPIDTGEPAPVAEDVIVREIDGVQYELHPVGMAQYIAELEAENAQAVADREAVRGSAHEGFKAVATQAITHAARLGGNQPMAGVYPVNTDAIPGIDAINAAAAQPQ